MPTGMLRLNGTPCFVQVLHRVGQHHLGLPQLEQRADQREHEPHVAHARWPAGWPATACGTCRDSAAPAECSAGPGTGCARPRDRAASASCRRPGRACGSPPACRASPRRLRGRRRSAPPPAGRRRGPGTRNSVRYSPMPSAPRSSHCSHLGGELDVAQQLMRTPSVVSAGRSRSVSSFAASERCSSTSWR